MGSELERRRLMVPYRRPFRYVLARGWRSSAQMRWRTTLAVGFWLAAAAGATADSIALRGVGVLGGIVASIAAFPYFQAVVSHTVRLKRAWRKKSELGTVRRHRPQAGSADPDIAHDEYAVSVEDAGHLVTWRFRPLAVNEFPATTEIEVPGRPRYAASPIDQRPFDARDAARAAEQLVEAQERATERERAAVDAAQNARIDGERRAELALEAKSTAAALQRTTGQRSRRD